MTTYSPLTEEELQQVTGILQLLDKGDAQSFDTFSAALRKMLQAHAVLCTLQTPGPVATVRESVVAAIVQCSNVPHDLPQIGATCYDAGYADAAEHYQMKGYAMTAESLKVEDVPDLAAMICELIQDAHKAYPKQFQKLLAVHVPMDGAERVNPVGAGLLPMLTALCVRWYSAIGKPVQLPAIRFTDPPSAEAQQFAGAQPYLWAQYNAGAMDDDASIGLGHAVYGVWTTDIGGPSAGS